MSELYIVRQQVCSINSCWLVDVYKSTESRLAWQAYTTFRADHPGKYFELVKSTGSEICLEHTPKDEQHEDAPR